MFPAIFCDAIIVIESGTEPDGPEDVTPVDVLWNRRRAGSYLQRVTIHFPFLWFQKRSRSGSLALVSDEGTRDEAVN